MANTPAARPREIIFSYIKSPLFRVLRTDGAVLSIGGQGTVHLSLFSERAAIPQQTTHVLADDGTISAELVERRVSKEGLVREVDVDAVLTLPTAIALRDLLDSQIKALQAALSKPQQGPAHDEVKQ